MRVVHRLLGHTWNTHNFLAGVSESVGSQSIAVAAVTRNQSIRNHIWNDSQNFTHVPRAPGSLLSSALSHRHPQLTAPHIRACSSTSNSGKVTAPTLQRRIRELLLVVHPDKWANNPAAQKQNERSCKLLQDYLSAAKGGAPGAAAGAGYRFVFFVPQRLAESPDVPAAEAIQELPPKKVAVILPPPARSQPTSGGGLPQTTARALAKLLDACGLDSEFSGGLDEGQAVYSRLSTFIPHAAEQTRAVQQLGMQPQIHIIRSALRLNRQCVVHLSPGLQQQSQGAQVQALEQLVAALDGCHRDVGGAVFVLSNSFKTDHVGRVHLDFSTSTHEWQRYIATVDLQHCSQLRRHLREVQHLEDRTAQAAGLAAVVAENDTLAMQPQFADFLARLRDSCAAEGPISSGSLSSIPLTVWQAPSFDADAARGRLAVPVGASVQEVRAYIKEHGHAVLTTQRQRQAEQQRLQHLSDKVKRMLRLRSLSMDPAIESRQAFSCLERLLHHHATLSDATDGLSMRISDANRITADASQTDIAWNFEL